MEDSTPLRSQTESVINETFNTEFGVIDQIIVQRKNGEDFKTLTVLNSTDFAEKINSSLVGDTDQPESDPDYYVTFKTSESMKEYSKDQSIAEMSYYQSLNIMCYEENCVELNNGVHEWIDDELNGKDDS
ncbi:hypothetical protein [Pseudalkalibacillus sp. SCS-8]|uniref:hypothetical protein n=1 Tax=Pseudalkalibacillus nanhaiensis TaxID=3115291 RepID=UPI0032DA28DD